MSPRADHDHYSHDLEVVATEELIARIPALSYGNKARTLLEAPRILEPCHGTGNISGTIRRLLPDAVVITNDVDHERAADHHVDALDDELFLEPVDWIITNPPFNDLGRLIPGWVERARVGVAVIAPINFREPRQNRAAFLSAHPMAACWDFIRVSWSGNGGTAMHHCAFMVWTQARLEAPANAPILLPAKTRGPEAPQATKHSIAVMRRLFSGDVIVQNVIVEGTSPRIAIARGLEEIARIHGEKSIVGGQVGLFS